MDLGTTSLDYSPPGDAHKLGTRGPYDHQHHHHHRLAKKKSKKSPRLIIVTNNLPLTFSCDHAALSQRMKRCTCGDKAKDSSDFDSDDMELEEERPDDSCGICYHKESKREGMGIGSSAHKRRVGAGKSYPRLNARSLTTFGSPSALGHSEISKQYEEPMSAVERAKRWRIEQSADHLLLKVTQLLKAGLTAFQHDTVLWVGKPGVYIDDIQERKEVSKRCREEYQCIPVWVNPKSIVTKHNNFANGLLWSLFHYQKPSISYDESDYRAYRQINQLFAQVLLKNVDIQPDDMIWVHEYHLILVPHFLRSKAPCFFRMGFYLHIPFPSSEIYRIIPSPAREEILRGFLACQLIGLQSFDYVTHFLKSCTRILGVETSHTRVFQENNRTTTLGVFPACIDHTKIEKMLKTQAVQERIKQLETKFAGMKVVLGVDRLDYVKGIPQKLHAVLHFFTKYPEWRSKIVLIQVALPALISLKGHKKLKREVDELVGRVNHMFASTDYLPVQYLNHSIDDVELCALYSIAHAQIVTYQRGGMPSSALEYIICQKERQGVLILSEFTGAAQSLGSGSLLINPWNVKDVANAILKAVTMPVETRAQKMALLYNFVIGHNASRWAQAFVKALNTECANDNSNNDSIEVAQQRCSPAELTLRVLTSYHGKKRRLLIFSYDGTLVPFSCLPHTCRPTQKLLQTLQKLCDDPKNTVIVTSGQMRHVLEDAFVSLPALGLAAEHGFVYKPPHSTKWKHLIDKIDLSWMDIIKPIFQHFLERTPGSSVEIKEYHLTWHYSNTDNEYGKMQARDLQLHLEGNFGKWPINTEFNDRFVEVGPNDVDPTHKLRKCLLSRAFAQSQQNRRRGPLSNSHSPNAHDDNGVIPYDLALFVGDNPMAFAGLLNCDRRFSTESGETENEGGETEEIAQLEVVTASVGKKNKQATFFLSDSTQVVDFLDSLSSGYFVF